MEVKKSTCKLNKTEKDKQVNYFIEKFIERDNKRNEMLSNTNYMEWLDSFTLEYGSFSDDDWLYTPEKISSSNRENVGNLNLLYSGVDRYAQKNYFYPIPCDLGNYYKVKLGNIGYEIGVLTGQGSIFFCNRVTIENDQEFINFYDIMNNKKQDNVETIEEKLRELSYAVISSYENGVPLEAIADTLNKTLNELKEKKDDNQVKVYQKI